MFLETLNFVFFSYNFWLNNYLLITFPIFSLSLPLSLLYTFLPLPPQLYSFLHFPPPSLHIFIPFLSFPTPFYPIFISFFPPLPLISFWSSKVWNLESVICILNLVLVFSGIWKKVFFMVYAVVFIASGFLVFTFIADISVF